MILECFLIISIHEIVLSVELLNFCKSIEQIYDQELIKINDISECMKNILQSFSISVSLINKRLSKLFKFENDDLNSIAFLKAIKHYIKVAVR